MSGKNMLSFPSNNGRTTTNNLNKKKPPPRPPPPNLAKYKSKSTFNLNQQYDNLSLIEWSPPNSPINNSKRNHPFSGSVSSSFSSSTSSLASSKKSLEYDILPIQQQTIITTNHLSTAQNNNQLPKQLNVPTIFGPTIIRAQPPKPKPNRNNLQILQDVNLTSMPMPTVPPPSPPKCASNVVTPYGIALYDFPASQPTDLPLQVDDVVILLRKINSEWMYGRVLDKEGMFPANFVDVKVPLSTIDEDYYVNALYEFRPQQNGDLELKPGQRVRVIRKVSEEWLYGESNGKSGVFPYNFVDRIPNNL